MSMEIIKTGILKNSDKFGIKCLKNAINLKGQEFFQRKNFRKFSGVSLKKYGHVWFKLSKGDALFKTYDGEYKKEVKDLRIINELICSCLAKQIGINSAVYEPAILDDAYGVVTYNFLKENQKLLTLDNFFMPGDNTPSLVNISEKIDFYKMLGYDISKEEIILDLYKIMIFDAITLQSDRNSFNINFILDNDFNSIKVSPLFDNEFAFNVENLYNVYYIPEKNFSFRDLIANYSVDAKLLEVKSETLFDKRRYYKLVSSLTDLAKCNDEMKTFLIKTIKSLSVSNAINDVEKMGVEISNEYRQYIKTIVNGTKRLFLIDLAKPITEDTSFIYEEFIK